MQCVKKSKFLAAGSWPRGSKKLRGNLPLIIICVFIRFTITPHAVKIITIIHRILQTANAGFFLVVDDSFIFEIGAIPTVYRTMKMFHGINSFLLINLLYHIRACLSSPYSFNFLIIALIIMKRPSIIAQIASAVPTLTPQR